MSEFEFTLDALGRSVREQIADPIVLTTFKLLLRSHELLASLKALMADDAALVALAGSSQLHPHRFVKIPIAVTPAGTKLVVHGWSDRPGSDRDLHNHRWNFVSVVLRGELEATSYIATTDAAGDHGEFSYGSATDQASYPLELVGRVRLTATGTESMPCGTVYAQDHSVIHGTGEPAQGTLTLIVQAPASIERCRVFRPIDWSADGQDVVHPDRTLLRDTLSEVAVLLSTRDTR